MALNATDLALFKAASNLGGAISATELTSGLLGDVFDKFTGIETRDGITEYACLYVKNKGAEPAENVTVHIDSETSHGSVNATIGLGNSAVNGTETAIANKTTAPSSVTFVEATTEGAGLNIGTLAAGARKAIWIKLVVPAGTTAKNSYQFTPQINFDTGE